jgi:hypothetical protein
VVERHPHKTCLSRFEPENGRQAMDILFCLRMLHFVNRGNVASKIDKATDMTVASRTKPGTVAIRA